MFISTIQNEELLSEDGGLGYVHGVGLQYGRLVKPRAFCLVSCYSLLYPIKIYIK